MSEQKGLSVWQLTMMALGTVIGGSFFLGSAIAIREAGPAVIISYILGGVLVYFILYSLSEMTVAHPAPGSFRTYCENMYGPIAGFTIGWVYWTGLILAMSSEAIAVSVFLKRWLPEFSLPLLGAIIIIIVTLINLLGVDKLSKLEGGLAAIKLLALIAFIVTAVLLVSGLLPGQATAKGAGSLISENLFPRGIGGIAGSMLIVMFTYAGFEVIGLAASETDHPNIKIPRAITYTVVGLVGLYLLTVSFILPLVPTNTLSEDISPLVAALSANGLNLAGDIINIILVIAILSTMLAATFGIARTIRSLADDGHAPQWLKEKGDIPYKGIIFSGLAMLLALAMGYILPKQVYVFLVSSGGFSLLFVYIIILATHYKFRKINGCPPSGCSLPGYPYSSILALISLLLIVISMPLVPGQGSGLIAGLLLVAAYILIYLIKKFNYRKLRNELQYLSLTKTYQVRYGTEFAEEISPEKDKKKPASKNRPASKEE